jgi:hypothetical protein
MMPKSILFNNVILFLCCSIYFGTGISLVFFQLPLVPQLTPESYQLVFVGPVQRATQFFTYMTIVMLVTATVMLATEWLSGIRWVPLIVLLAVISATALTIYGVFDLNKALTSGGLTQQELRLTLEKWATFNRIRAALWTVEWMSMMYWFARLAVKARSDR